LSGCRINETVIGHGLWFVLVKELPTTKEKKKKKKKKRKQGKSFYYQFERNSLT
jgi:hypothetical protein